MRNRTHSKYRPGNYFFLVPLLGCAAWWGMLIAMLVCWGVQGRPIYYWMNQQEYVDGIGLVYISDIGATNLQPLFISLSAFQGLVYSVTLALEYFQRCGRWPFLRHSVPVSANEKDTDEEEDSESDNVVLDVGRQKLVDLYPFYMPFWFSRHERNLMFASFVFACLGELALLICSIFDTRYHHTVHITMVGLFLAFLAISVILSGTEYILMGKHYRKIHPQHNCWNKYMVSGIWKLVWVSVAIVYAILFGALDVDSISAVFEWPVAFWYGLIFVTFSVDFYLGGRYKYSKHFPYVESFQGFYKYDRFYAQQKALSGPTIEQELSDPSDQNQSPDLVV